LFFSDSQYEHSAILFQEIVHVAESTEGFSIVTSLVSLALFSFLSFGIGFALYVRLIEDRFCPKGGTSETGSKKAKSQEKASITQIIRELVSRH
jgi:hypothetical protein